MASVVSSRQDDFPAAVAAGRGRIAFTVAGLATIGVIIGLIVSATLESGMYYLTVDEFLERQTELHGKHVRVNGEVVAGTEVWNAKATRLEFQIRDAGSPRALPAVYIGPRPDNFQRAVSVILEGSLTEDGIFLAEELLTKCPSRYEETAPNTEGV